jgi:hypothetical protein
MTTPSSKRRTNQERVELIFKFIDLQPDVFPKSRLKEIGLNPDTAEKWLKLIEFIQSQPKIRLIKTEHNTMIEKVEGKYQTLMLKTLHDESISYDQRLMILENFLKSLYTRERLKGKHD